MYPGFSELNKQTYRYCFYIVKLEECKWYEFKKKKHIKEYLNWLFPIMRGEVETISYLFNKK